MGNIGNMGNMGNIGNIGNIGSMGNIGRIGNMGHISRDFLIFRVPLSRVLTPAVVFVFVNKLIF